MTNTALFRKHTVTDGHDPEVWFPAAPVEDFPEDGGVCVKVGPLQIAVFNFTRREREWYACQNLCPHKMEMALSRGILGSSRGIPKVACPYHKASFDLTTGKCLSAEIESLSTYPVRVADGHVFIGLSRVPDGLDKSFPAIEAAATNGHRSDCAGTAVVTAEGVGP